ncbi:hypothetical protein [Hoeflea alexandrii]|uniref:hypothetical protein n=1 Tax=Hoeflea alexandrii TaxID=288436 RepID=UPI0022AF89E0|nr:hypothetical protein [Hoeflea alexandrii]
MATNPILEQLSIAKRELSDLDQQINDLLQKRAAARARVDAFELSAKYIQDMQPQGKTAARSSASPRQRMPSDDWRRIFGELCTRYQSGFGYDEVMGVAASLGIGDLKKPSLRTKMMNLANSGYAERLDEGRFRITQEGMKYFGLLKPETNEASEQSAHEAPQVTEGAGIPFFENEDVDDDVFR